MDIKPQFHLGVVSVTGKGLPTINGKIIGISYRCDIHMDCRVLSIHNIRLVVSTSLKNISQLGLLFPIYGKIKMFQTTNQI